MNGRKAKEIRSIVKPEDATTRRVYRRVKKLYTRTPNHKREALLNSARIMIQGVKSEEQQTD